MTMDEGSNKPITADSRFLQDDIVYSKLLGRIEKLEKGLELTTSILKDLNSMILQLNERIRNERR